MYNNFDIIYTYWKTNVIYIRIYIPRVHLLDSFSFNPPQLLHKKNQCRENDKEEIRQKSHVATTKNPSFSFFRIMVQNPLRHSRSSVPAVRYTGEGEANGMDNDPSGENGQDDDRTQKGAGLQKW